MVVGGIEVKFRTLQGEGGCLNRTGANKGGWGGGKFWAFCHNVIIECPCKEKCTFINESTKCYQKIKIAKKS